MTTEPTAETALRVGDTIHVRQDGRAYMRVQVTGIQNGRVEAIVTWAVIIALTYWCPIQNVTWARDRWQVDHGFIGSNRR